MQTRREENKEQPPNPKNNNKGPPPKKKAAKNNHRNNTCKTKRNKSNLEESHLPPRKEQPKPWEFLTIKDLKQLTPFP